MAHGPIMTGMTIYEDFYSYKEGVYRHETGDIDGGHAVKLLGWGHDDNNELYWIC